MEIRGKNEYTHIILKYNEKKDTYEDVTNKVIYIKENFSSWYVVFDNNKGYPYSFNKIINRQQMQRIPYEFSEGKYTSKTDMFCVAELFWRMIKKYNVSDFKHEYILNKMMSLDPDKRYDSFKDILAALDKKDMKALEISDDDKIIYREFTESVYGVLAEFSETPNIELNISNVLEGLQQLLESNCLNESVQNVTELIGVFVKSGYRYYNTRYVDVEAIYNFYNWFISKDEPFQKVILKNIKNRLLSRPIKVGEELPF